MAPPPYPDFRWFFRTLKVVPVVAVAALAGGLIGGFSVFAVNLAVTAPPNYGVPPEPGSKLADATADDRTAADTPGPRTAGVQPATPIRTFDAAAPAAATVTPASAAVNMAPPASPPPASGTPSTMASGVAANPSFNLPAVAEPTPLSVQHVSPAGPPLATLSASSDATAGAITVAHPPVNATELKPAQSPTTETAATAVPQANAKPEAKPETKPDSTRRHALAKRPAPTTERTGEVTLPRRQDADEDSRQDDDDNARVEYRAAAPRHDLRRHQRTEVVRSGDRRDDRVYDRYDGPDAQDDGEGRDALPAQPPPLPFFGLFGGGDGN